MEKPNQLVVVDTNCLVRVYFSPLRPIFGRVVDGYELKTLAVLAEEIKTLAERNDFAWLSDKVILSEADAATLKLSKLERDTINEDARAIRKHGNAELYQEYLTKNLETQRSLSVRA
ncbi:hypothetical protein [Macromonas bipunctata]|uniref:hypothetical protein n=1 Tax=Macromonas bipunctata TaxID=183670 RepID=UPI0011AFA836|nr:hypothetical protein [Macromonas bipunctata]